MGAASVIFGLAGILVNITVNFNNKFMTEANEINDKKLDGVLSPKFSTQPGGPQLLPQSRFGEGGRFAIFAGVGFGLVPGTDVGSVNMLMGAAEAGGVAHGWQGSANPAGGTSPPGPRSKKEGEPDDFLLEITKAKRGFQQC